MDYLVFVLGLILIALLILFWKYAELRGRIEQRARQIFEEWKERELESASTEKAKILFEEWKQKYEKEIRRDAIEKSKATITGKITEHLTPYLPGFNYNPKDARFIGSPIDLIVFDGLDEGELRKIVFVEVKTGKSKLSKRERIIRDTINKNRVEWEVLRFERTGAEIDVAKELDELGDIEEYLQELK
jgi:predicted Holliday junction resolvase-like endonuclease